MVSASSNASKRRPSSARPAASIISGSSPTKRPCSFRSSNVDGVGLRRAIGDEEVERLFGLLGDGKIDNHQNWKGRFKDNSDKMRSGSIYDVADVLKSLTFLAKSKSLSFREKRMLDRAKFLIISEVSEVMRETARGDRRARRPRARALLHGEGARRRRRAREGRAKAAPRARRGARAPRRRARAAQPAPRSSRSRARDVAHASPQARTIRRAFSFMIAARVIIAAVRSVATYVAVSLYVLIVGPLGHAARRSLFGWKGTALRARSRRRAARRSL